RPPGRTEAWVVCPGDCTLHVIDTQQRIKLDTLQFDAPPSDITFTPDGSKVFVGFNGTPGRIAEFDVALQESLSCWEMGRGPWDLSVSLDGCYLAAADSLGGTLYVYDLTAGRWYSTPVDSAAIRVRYSAYNATWFVLSQAGQRLQRVVLEGDSAVVEGSVWMEPTISDFVIWE
ncbi:hypothetical protein KKH27_06945, partial [bacterium]|nr:hypothetical protein [bacterium]